MTQRPKRATGRWVAAEVVARVLADGAWVTPTLSAELAAARLEPREAARATDLAYGSVRAFAWLDARIRRHLTRSGALEPFAHAVLLVAARELCDPRAEHGWATVNESVEVARLRRGEGLARFVNAVLRKLASELDAELSTAPEPDRVREARSLALGRIELPDWLPPLLPSATVGDLEVPALHVMLRARCDRAALLARLRDARPTAEITESPWTPLAIRVRSAGDPRELPGYDTGDFVVQEEAAQRVAQLVGAKAGERILDACAGHGGKTLAILDATSMTSPVVAVDDHPEKLDSLARELARLGVPAGAVEPRAIDWTRGRGGLEATFDRVLVDAPCTGLGTLSRRPEILLRVGHDDVARMARVQSAILRQTADLVAPGGELVYVVCSPTEREGAGVVRDFLAANPSFENITAEAGPGTSLCEGVLAVGSTAGIRGVDAFQIARMKRRS